MTDQPDSRFDTTLRLLAPGQRVFERFTLEHVLGQGGMGVVWKARDEVLEKDVALKFVLEAHARDPEAVAGLKRETRRCQELRHAGIVAIYDLHQEGDRVAVSMEYVVGSTLAARKAERPAGCFDCEELLPWLDQLNGALTYAHREARVVHRDLKPSNLILTGTGRVKVMDFGISQPLSGTIATRSSEGAFGISLPYGSPQQLLGERARVEDDVYSLGATIYELLTGRPPFFRGKIDLQVLETVPPELGTRRAELGNVGAPIPRQWEEVIARSLAKDPSDRPQSISELIGALCDGWAKRTFDAPVVKIAVPRTEPVPASPSTAPKTEPAREETVVPVGWVAPSSPIPKRESERSWFVTPVIVLGLAALTALGIRWFRHSPAPPAPTTPAPAAQVSPEKPRPDPLRPAALQPTGAKPPPRR